MRLSGSAAGRSVEDLAEPPSEAWGSGHRFKDYRGDTNMRIVLIVALLAAALLAAAPATASDYSCTIACIRACQGNGGCYWALLVDGDCDYECLGSGGGGSNIGPCFRDSDCGYDGCCEAGWCGVCWDPVSGDSQQATRGWQGGVDPAWLQAAVGGRSTDCGP